MWVRAISLLRGANSAAASAPPFRSSTSGSDSAKSGMSYRGVQEFSVADPIMAAASGSAKPKQRTKDEVRAFKEILPDIIRDLTFSGPFADVPKVNEHVSKCLQYNLMHGKLNRGLGVPISYKLLADDHSEESMQSARLLGWCVEMLHAFYLVADDIMDESETRRGQPCWYKREGVGMMAVNDGLIMESCVYALLKQRLGSENPKACAFAIDTFLEANRKSVVGQSLDMLSQAVPRSCGKGHGGTVDDFNMKLYNNIVKYKTAHYSFCLPVHLAMGLAGIKDEELYRQSSTILLETGKFFQVQDDYLDCFGDPSVTGKKGRDIQDGKCSWLAVLAMQRATPKQKEFMRDNYGRGDKETAAQVKELYEELKLPKVFLGYEEEEYNDILTRISQLSGGSSNRRLNPDVFHHILDSIYKRET